MIINRENLQRTYQSFKVLFVKGLKEGAQDLWKRIASEIPSSAGEELYRWLGFFPRVREWIGARQLQNLSSHGYTIRNKDWELTIPIDRNDIADDKLGLYSQPIQGLGQAFRDHTDELVFGLLKMGFNTVCYDGQYFFDTDHQDGQGPVQSNRGNGKLTPERYGAARAAMLNMKDEHGRPLNIVPGLLVVAPANEEMAKKILNNERINAGESNPWKGTAELMVAPWLSDTPDYWFLMDTTKPVKPLILQLREAPQFDAMTDFADEHVFFNKEYLFGGFARYNAGFGFWQTAYGSTGEVA